MNNEITTTNANALRNELANPSNKMSVSEKAKLFNLIANAETKLSDKVNEVINIKEIFFTFGSLTNTETGEVEDRERAIILDDEGHSFHTMGAGAISALHTLCTVFGEPSTWEQAVPCKVIKKDTKRGIIYTLEVVESKK